MDEKIIAKGIFIKTKKVIRKLIDGSIIIIIVFSLLSGIVYWAEKSNFKSDASEALYQLCGEIEDYYSERIDAWNMPKTEKSMHELAMHDVELKYENIKVDIQGRKYRLKNLGYDFFNNDVGVIYLNSHDAPDSLVEAVTKQYNSWYIKNGNAIKMLIIGAVISVILLMSALVVSLFFGYNKLIITNQMIYTETRKKNKISIPIKSISSVSTINPKGIAIITDTGTKRIRLIKNREEIFDIISNLIKKQI